MIHFRVVKTSYVKQKILFFTYYWFHLAQYISNEFMIVKNILITIKYKMMTTNTILQQRLLVTKFLLIMNPKFSSPITYPS